jgi:hypothetical protein
LGRPKGAICWMSRDSLQFPKKAFFSGIL